MSHLDKIIHVCEELRVFSRNLSKDNKERKLNVDVTNKKLLKLNNIESQFAVVLTSFNVQKNNVKTIKKAKKYVLEIESLIKEIRNCLEERQTHIEKWINAICHQSQPNISWLIRKSKKIRIKIFPRFSISRMTQHTFLI